MSILMIAGSPSVQSRSRLLLDFVGLRLAQTGWKTRYLDLRDLPAQALLHDELEHETIKRALAQVDAAQAIVLSTPIYKAAYSGLLKIFLDLLPQAGLAGKVVLPLATAGSGGHRLALDYALAPVLSTLAARVILPGVYALDRQISWSPDSELVVDLDVHGRLVEAVTRLLQNLEPSDKTTRKISRLISARFSVPFSRVRCSF